MKTQVFRAALVAGTLAVLVSVNAHRSPAEAPLPDVDRRASSNPRMAGLVTRPVATRGEFTASQRQAVVSLGSRVVGLRVAPSLYTGSPRLLATERGFLTGPNGAGGAVSAGSLATLPANDPHRLVKAFVNEHQALFGHDARALTAAAVSREYVTAHNGLRTTIWQQQYAGIPVFEGVFQSHVSKKGELVRISSQFLADVATAVAVGNPRWASLAATPGVSGAQAVAVAAADVGVEFSSSAVRQVADYSGAELKSRMLAPGLNGEVYAQLVWLPLGPGSARLCWQLILVSRERREMFRTLVDAESGEVMVRHNLTRYQAPPTPVAGSYRVYTGDSPSPFSPGWPTPNVVQPPLQYRVLLTNLVSLNATASPAGWLNPANPFTGAFNTTGNNVDAHTDLDDNDIADTPRPSSTDDPPVFDFPFGLLNDDVQDLLLQAPTSYTNASVVNLFYLNNFMHDKLYELGFTEAAGNFQNDNFGRGGLGGDAVEADSLDGGLLNDPFHRNNANFYPPPDGIPGRMQMYVFDGPIPNRDGSLDAEVVCHEYTHGLTDRLVGGGVGITALQTAGMAEGWSDFYPMCLLSDAKDDPRGVFASGGYASYLLLDLTENYYYGIRRYPYCTDMAKNPLTFKDIDPSQADEHFGIPSSPIWGTPNSYPEEVHNQGEVWCIMLWEMRANLVDTYGWETGNQLALQLVTDGLKLCPANPTYVEARDAIVEADKVLTGGANATEIWLGFAKRGMGYAASAPDSDTTVGVVEDYTLPPGVGNLDPTGVLTVSVTPPDRATIFGGNATNILILIRDGVGVTNAVVTAKVNGTVDLPVNNAGTPPDSRPGDAVYSAQLAVPDNATNVTLLINAAAQDKTNATLTVTYFVARQPGNDLFSKRTKVPGAGTSYVSNNKFATTEAGEPAPAGVSNFVASLWWTWTPTSSSRVLVDTAGSAFRSVVAVYTGSTLTNLLEVKAVGAVPERRQSYLYFDAKAGETYQISVAGASPANSGLLRMRIAPNGSPDITPPIITIATPPSGYIWTNNVIPVVAAAVDPEPLSSGVDQITFRVSPRQFGPDVVKTASLTSSTANIALAEGRNTITITASDGSGNTSSTNILVTFRRPEPYNDHFVQAGELASEQGTNKVANALATKEPGEPRHAGNDGGKSVWWQFQAPRDGILLLSTEGTDFDTLLGLYTGERVGAISALAANDDAFEGSAFSKVRQAVRSNVVYHIAVDGFNAATGRVQLAHSFSGATLNTVQLSQTSGGITVPAAGSMDVEAGSAVQLFADPDPGYEFAGWTGDIATSENPVPVPVTQNLAIRATFRPQPVADDFESGGLSRLPWVTGGSLPWLVTSETAGMGKQSVRSGAITHSQTSTLSLTQPLRAGVASFDVKVSSESGWDALDFLVDGVVLRTWSGEVEWTKFEFAVSAGTHTLEWRYQKDPANSHGLDAAFVDNVALPIVVADDGTVPKLAISRAFTGGVEVRLQGQTNQLYVIQATEVLPGKWRSVYTNTAAYGEVIYIDPESVTLPQRYYRGLRP